MGKSMNNGGGASNSQGPGPVQVIIDGSRLNEQHQLLNP